MPGSKRKRSSSNRKHYNNGESGFSDDDSPHSRRATRKKVNYAEDDTSSFVEDFDDEEDPQLDDNAAAEVDYKNEDGESVDGDHDADNGKNLRVKLRFRNRQQSDGHDDDIAEVKDEADFFEESEEMAEVQAAKQARESRRAALQRRSAMIRQQQDDGQDSGDNNQNNQGKLINEVEDIDRGQSETRRLSASTIRQQLIQQSQKMDRSRKNSYNKHQGSSDDEEFQLDESSEVDDDDDSEGDDDGSEYGSTGKRKSRNKRTDNFVVEDESEGSDDSEYGTRTRTRSGLRRSTRASSQARKRQESSNEDEPLTLEQELAELEPVPQQSLRKNLRARREVNYQILPPPPIEQPEESFTASRRRTTSGTRRLHSTYGPFGGAGINSIFGTQPRGLQAAGGAADSDSSDDEGMKNSNAPPKPPTSAELEQITNPAGSLGLVKKNNLADSDPLGVDMNIDFNAVGGLDDQINQLKEMVALPLMYPEVFQKFKITPPRGVLFHGPPGTGKTLLARALAASCSTETRKISFYMRKGADALSKWVGEAERQLRLLFEEARNTQPSIIFFDEIDGLAPVRSSKQEQIHASIVSTLLALMDGMDNRGQVIVIGATNRPDSIDPALRRPGRFDREFYFPLPNLEARKKIIEIHTKKWEPPLSDKFISDVAELTKGYGGADLRALCTESAINAIQRRYPQIYSSNDKLLIDPSSITVTPRDFMTSLKKIIPSSARSNASNAQPLPKRVEPLLGPIMKDIKDALDKLIPRRKKLSIAEEAMYEDDTSTDEGFARENMMQEFESMRIFRPRMLISGSGGMGQEYIGAAILQYLEGFHIQSFDLATIMGDPTRTMEAAIVQMFVEVKRHTPSVVYIPNIESWFKTLTPSAWTTFVGLVRNLSPTDQILILGVVECEFEYLSHEIKGLFGFSQANRFELKRPGYDDRYKFFNELVTHLSNPPTAYPDRENRRKRQLEVLPKAPLPPPHVPTAAELKVQEEKDKRLKNFLKIKLSGLMDLLKVRYKRFRKPAIDEDLLYHLFDPAGPDPNVQYEYVATDDQMILERSTGKKYYNMDLDVIEERLWNGYYCTPKQYLQDISQILEDANTSGDRDKIVRASEMYANVQVSVDEIGDQQFLLDCERMAEREKQRTARYNEKLKRKQEKIEALLQEPPNDLNGLTTESRLLGQINGTEKALECFNHENIIEIDGPMEDIIEQKTSTEYSATQPNGSMMNLEPSTSPVSQTMALTTSANLEEKPLLAISPAVVADLSLADSVGESTAEKEHEPYQLDHDLLNKFHSDLTHMTEDFVVEQLEQVNSALIDLTYQSRMIWNRTAVIRDIIAQSGDIAREVQMIFN
ncbi:hypothetical protein V1511DRAFT_486369 [Dipodascopsis uninucleata]